MTPKFYHRLLWTAIACTAAAAGAVAQSAAPQRAAQPSASAPAPAQPPRSSGGGWWHSQSWRKEVGITAEQAKRLDNIWDDAVPKLKENYTQLDERESKLSRLIEQNEDEQTISAQIDRVETMRSTLNKQRELMLVHMRAVLTPAQRVSFNQRWVQLREAQQQASQRPPAPDSSQHAAPSAGTQRPAPASGATPAKRPE
jgi:Spy/CpxP family protein refolding chaperone